MKLVSRVAILCLAVLFGTIICFIAKIKHITKTYHEQHVNSVTRTEPYPTKQIQFSFVNRSKEIDCRLLMEDDESEKERAQTLMKVWSSHKPPEQGGGLHIHNCTEFISRKGYVLESSKTEYEFPVAFTMLIHENAPQLEHLLRYIYRPNNAYCVHVDLKAPKSLHDSVKQLTRCFSNVFIASKSENVVYASFSRLQAELNCMAELLERREKWRYLINLASTMFPLKTNLEMVKILKIYGGINDIEGLYPNQELQKRYIYKHEIIQPDSGPQYIIKTDVKKAPPPHEINIVKGSAYGTFSRAFIQFALTDRKARDLLEWSRDTYSPDEFFWATLHHIGVNPQFHSPGGYRGDPEKKPWLATYAAWPPRDKCSGTVVRGICIFGIGDLPTLMSRRELFANKFSWHKESIVLHCLGEWIRWKFNYTPPIDGAYYKQLDFANKNR